MKKVLLVLAMVALTFSMNAQSNSPLKTGVYDLKGYKSLGVDTSSLEGVLVVVDGGLRFVGDFIPTKKYNVFFIGEHEASNWEVVDDLGTREIVGLGYWGTDNMFEDGDVYVILSSSSKLITLSTPEGNYHFIININK